MKILIGIITYDGKDYCKDRFFKNLDSIDPLHNYPRIIIDNSSYPDYALKSLMGLGQVIRERNFANKKAGICNSRNRLIEEFLKTDCDYLLHLESDVLPPSNIIYSLLKWKKKIVCGWYYIGQQRGEEGSYMTPCISDAKKPLNELDLCKERLLKVFVGSLGCCLIHRSIFEKGYRFWIRDDLSMADDGAFWYDMWEKDIPVYVDTDMLCIHFPNHYREIK